MPDVHSGRGAGSRSGGESELPRTARRAARGFATEAARGHCGRTGTPLRVRLRPRVPCAVWIQIAKGRAETPERAWIPAWAWVAAAALVLFAGYTTFQMRQFSREVAVLERQGAQEQQRSRALDSERERYLQALNIIGAAATRHLQLKPGKAAMPPVTAYWNPGMGLVLAADKMPDMPPGRTLQLWVVPQQGAPISVGIFRPNAAGQVLMVMPPANAMLMAKALAISDEPAGGSPQPTSTPEWVGPVS